MTENPLLAALTGQTVNAVKTPDVLRTIDLAMKRHEQVKDQREVKKATLAGPSYNRFDETGRPVYQCQRCGADTAFLGLSKHGWYSGQTMPITRVEYERVPETTEVAQIHHRIFIEEILSGYICHPCFNEAGVK